MLTDLIKYKHRDAVYSRLRESTQTSRYMELYRPQTVQNLVIAEAIEDLFSSLSWNSLRDPYAFKRNILATPRRRSHLGAEISAAEIKARKLLRDSIPEKDWRRYITNGFLLVRGASGKIYQIFPSQRWVHVYDKGKLQNTICIHTEGNCPPTDHVLNLKTLLEIDENLLYIRGNVHGEKVFRYAGNCF